MVKHNWDYYKPGELGENVKCWVDMWEDTTSRFNEKFFGLELVNPQLLVKLILDEIDDNGLMNERYKKYLYRLIDHFYKNDPAIKSSFRVEFGLLRKEFNSHNVAYIRHVCNLVIPLFAKGRYFDEEFRHLTQRLFEEGMDQRTRDELQLMTKNLVIELYLKGFSLDEMQPFAYNLFDKYRIEEGELITRYPYQTVRSGDDQSENSDKSFQEAVRTEIDSLRIQDRINRFAFYFHDNRSYEHTFIFRIEGLKGGVEINIGPVVLYSPIVKPFIVPRDGDPDTYEYFGLSKEAYLDTSINAAVKIKYHSLDAGEIDAIHKIEKALDILRCIYKSKAAFEIRKERLIICNESGNVIFESIGPDPRVLRQRFNCLDMNNANDGEYGIHEVIGNIDDILFDITNERSDITKRLNYSLHWFRKAEETDNQEDKMLWYWIVLENLLRRDITGRGDETLLKKTKILPRAVNYVPPIQSKYYTLNIGWELYHYIQSFILTLHDGISHLELPKTIIDTCHLAPTAGESVSIINFINHLDLLLEYVDREIIRGKILYTKRFYSDNSFALQELEKYIGNITDDILVIYRFRNKIVHHAHYDNSILPFYVEKIRNYSGDLLREIIGGYKDDRNVSIESILTSNCVALDLVISKLAQEATFNILENH